jgi:hypothetical protein
MQNNNTFHSLCSTTPTPISPSITVFSHGYSDSRIVPYPTYGTKPTTLPTTSWSRSRYFCPRAYSSVSSAALLSPLVRSCIGLSLAIRQHLANWVVPKLYSPAPKPSSNSMHNRDILSSDLIHHYLPKRSILPLSRGTILSTS